MQGIALDGGNDLNRTPGFLFDMNVFFQFLLSRFLRENLVNYRIEDEFVIRDIFRYAPENKPQTEVRT